MPSLIQNKLLPYRSKDLFSMVLDVERYPEFLPWCYGARIISRNENNMVAELVIQFKGVVSKYQSLITTQISQDNYSIDIKAISGPFKYLTSSWQFQQRTPSDLHTQVEFKTDFEFKFQLLDKIIGNLFMLATQKMITAFEARADGLYGCC